MARSKYIKIITFLAIVLVIVALVIFLDQVIRYHVIFEPDDFLHHENFFVLFLAIGLTMIAMIFILNSRKK